MVAGYLAKYATKSTEATGHTSTRITLDNHPPLPRRRRAHRPLIAACWRLGTQPPTPARRPGRLDNPYLRLRRWAHMLGFGGHFLTKARRYSITFAHLRGNRATYRRTPNQRHRPTTTRPAPRRHGRGHHPRRRTPHLRRHRLAHPGDAMLANTAAAYARERHQVGREELTPLHTSTSPELVAA